VVERWAKNNGFEIPDGFSTEPERKLFDKYINFFQDHEIPFVNATPVVVRAFTKSALMKEDFYPFHDGHPLANGYESYSRAAEELILNKLNQNPHPVK